MEDFHGDWSRCVWDFVRNVNGSRTHPGRERESDIREEARSAWGGWLGRERWCATEGGRHGIPPHAQTSSAAQLRPLHYTRMQPSWNVVIKSNSQIYCCHGRVALSTRTDPREAVRPTVPGCKPRCGAIQLPNRHPFSHDLPSFSHDLPSLFSHDPPSLLTHADTGSPGRVIRRVLSTRPRRLRAGACLAGPGYPCIFAPKIWDANL